MDTALNFGIWSILPPLLTIALALIFKDVILALATGILSGALLIHHGNIFSSIGFFADKIAESLADGWNIRIFLFCAALGGLVSLLNKTGSVRSFGQWAAGKLKSRRGTLLFTFVFGILIFIDDYFNSLAIGTAMRPVCDRFKISRAKLAYILDSTAAPVCIIAPISSWVVIIMSYSREAKGFSELGISELDLFIRLIPYNFYVFLTFFMILALIFIGRDFGPMRRAEERAQNGEGLYDRDTFGENRVPEESPVSQRARPMDMMIPFIILIASAIASFPITTWKIAAEKSGSTLLESFHQIGIRQAFCDTDASYALMYSIVFTMIFVIAYFLIRRLLKLREITDSLISGAQSMVPVLIILTFAWTIGSIIKNSPADGGVGLADYLANMVRSSHFPFWLLPLSVFGFSCIIAFSTGTSWGTMAIMISIVLPIAVAGGKELGLSHSELLNAVCFTLSATIGGAIFGDHTSPISDTTILSATGAGCPCLEHVETQMPYAASVAGSAALGYLCGSFFNMNIYIGGATALGTLILLLIFFIYLRPKAKRNKTH
ncbi:MAG: Na+/H+ antiporter NhaC family protein [Planctomycetia bacterium]|nr:Na+/H+ antiporter NhaC family protein [Planctomycetia bacterium]